MLVFGRPFYDQRGFLVTYEGSFNLSHEVKAATHVAVVGPSSFDLQFFRIQNHAHFAAREKRFKRDLRVPGVAFSQCQLMSNLVFSVGT
jgi:hypothetical protein